MKAFKKPLFAFAVFLLIQVAISLVLVFPITMVSGFIKAAQGEDISAIAASDPSSLIPTTALAIVLIVSSVISVFVMQKPMKMVTLKESFALPTIPAWKCVLYVLAAFVGIYATDIISEIMDLPNLIEAELGDMSKTVLGILAIAIVGPLAEEVVFRGAIMGHFLKEGFSPAKAIFWSALMFGIMHFNPAQIPFAMVVGLILGMFYWKTGSLFLPCLIHMINNATSCILSDTMGEDFSLVEPLGGTMPALAVAAVAACVCVFALSKLAKEE